MHSNKTIRNRNFKIQMLVGKQLEFISQLQIKRKFDFRTFYFNIIRHEKFCAEKIVRICIPKFVTS